MSTPRTICVVTGTRAEFGLLQMLMSEIRGDPSLKLQIIATGMHLSPEFGLTYRSIEQEGFAIDEKVEMLLSSDTPEGIAASVGLGVIGFAAAFRRLAPDIVVVLGDRFEILAAAQAALFGRIPLAHIHGGETTEGAVDEAIRHSITKMAHLHFTATETYRRRVIQLGEHPDRVFNVGTPALDNLQCLKFLSREELETSVGLKFRDVNFIVTYHPGTLEARSTTSAMKECLAALDRFPEAAILFTKPNADTDGRAIIGMLDEYAARHTGRVVVHTSLGRLRYLSALKHMDVVIGNSSSGLIEAPSFKTPTVNIGDRQQGRLRAASVIDCAADRDAIEASIRRALSPEFQECLQTVQNPYGCGGASVQIRNILRSVDLAGIVKKRFYDLPGHSGPDLE